MSLKVSSESGEETIFSSDLLPEKVNGLASRLV